MVDCNDLSNRRTTDNIIWSLYYNENYDNSDDESNIIDIIYKNNKAILKTNNITKEFLKKRINKIKKYRKKLKDLKMAPLIKQRSPEWYELRKNRLTASDTFDAIANNNLLLAKKKAGIYIDDINLSKVPPIKWGTMFENMATRSYSQKNSNIKVNEFGLIPDKNLEHYGASPDGISELGIMIEIKCPYARKIVDGYIPPKYYTQMQGQLAVCDLEECDYVECDFKQYLAIENYLEEINKDDIVDHGIIAEFTIKSTDEYYYNYSDEYLAPDKCIENINEKIVNTVNSLNDIIFNKLIPWKLQSINIQRIEFNKSEWINTIPKIINFWKKVEECKKLPLEYKKVKESKEVKMFFIDDNDDDIINKPDNKKKKLNFIDDD